MSSTKPYHHGDLAESLIQAAAQLLSDKGPAQISLREIARLAGVSHGAPAHHFKDKTGLLTAVAVRGHEQLAQSLRNSQISKPVVSERLLAAGTAYVQFAVAHPGYFSVMFDTGLIEASPTYVNARAATQQVLTECLEELAGHGASAKNIVGMQTALWSQVHGFSVLWLAGNFGATDNDVALNELLAEMLRSIEPRIN